MSERNFTIDWTTKYERDWHRWLDYLKGKPGIRALEVGCHEGRSACWFCENILTGADCRLDCVDLWASQLAGYVGAEGRFDSNVAGLAVRKLKGDSVGELAKLLTAGNRYVFAYVDGCHHAEVALGDLALAWKMLCKGGLLIADDYRLTGRGLRLPPRVAIDGWLPTVMDSMDGFEQTANQVAVWKRP